MVASLDGVLSIPPSLYWDGADGSWSTFQIQVGTPAQTVRLLPGTSASAGNSIWVVLPEGCSINPNISNCGNERGYIFSRNESSTWSTQRLANGGLFVLSIYEESQLGLGGNAYYAFDTINLGIGGQGLPTLKNQVIAGIATNDFWLGSLGISPLSFNFTNIDNPVPSMMDTLRSQNLTGSTSWAYTAGAVYKDPPVFGSLTLGGFDNARLNSSSNVTVPFGSDISRDLLVAVRSITYNSLGSSPLLADGIYAFIDSMVSTMYLPVSVCQAFEQAFNLTWDSTHELYLLTAEQHTQLLAQDPVISFTLGNTTDRDSPAATTVIEFPYSAFDLNITQPYVGETSRYFPLKRAQNSSQYTLGRVFLQEAYVLADYDRQQFTVAQAAFPQRQSDQDLRAILPPSSAAQNSSSSPTNPPSTHKPHSSLSGGTIAGIAVGSIVVVALALGALWFFARRKRAQKSYQSKRGVSLSEGSHGSLSEAASTPMAELAPNRTDGYTEAGGNTIYEMMGTHKKYVASELPAKGEVERRKAGSNTAVRYEMADRERATAAAELEAGNRMGGGLYELSADREDG